MERSCHTRCQLGNGAYCNVEKNRRTTVRRNDYLLILCFRTLPVHGAAAIEDTSRAEGTVNLFIHPRVGSGGHAWPTVSPRPDSLRTPAAFGLRLWFTPREAAPLTLGGTHRRFQFQAQAVSLLASLSDAHVLSVAVALCFPQAASPLLAAPPISVSFWNKLDTLQTRAMLGLGRGGFHPHYEVGPPKNWSPHLSSGTSIQQVNEIYKSLHGGKQINMFSWPVP